MRVRVRAQLTLPFEEGGGGGEVENARCCTIVVVRGKALSWRYIVLTMAVVAGRRRNGWMVLLHRRLWFCEGRKTEEGASWWRRRARGRLVREEKESMVL